MVAHNKNTKAPSSQTQPRNPRSREPEDKVSRLWETDLICDLADPSLSVDQLCRQLQISLETLSTWMMRPEIAARLSLLQSAAMQRARLIGRLTLPTAAQSAANIINAHKLRPQKPTIIADFDDDTHRANKIMLEAARFLQRLSAEPAPTKRKSEAPSLREGVGEEREGREQQSADETDQVTVPTNDDSVDEKNADVPLPDPAGSNLRSENHPPTSLRESPTEKGNGPHHRPMQASTPSHRAPRESNSLAAPSPTNAGLNSS